MTDQQNHNVYGQPRPNGPPPIHAAMNGDQPGPNHMQWKPGPPPNNGPFPPGNFPQPNTNGLSSQTNSSQGMSLSNNPPVSMQGPPMMNGPNSRLPLGTPPVSQGQFRAMGPPVPQNQMRPGMGQPGPPRMMQPLSTAPGQDRPNELPIPYHGHGQYTHQVHTSLTPGSNSGPPSQKSSRTNSPAVPGHNFDALEGQFNDGSPQADNSIPRVPSTQWGPNNSQGGMPPQIRGPAPPGSSVPMQRPGFPPQPNLVGQPARQGFPPMPGQNPSQGFTSMSTQGQRPGFPPTTAGQHPGFMPPSVSTNQPLRPNQNPGFPPQPVSTNSQIRPMQQPGFPPLPVSTNSQIRPMQQPGFPPQPVSTNSQIRPMQQPGFPPPPVSTNPQIRPNQQPWFPPASQPSTNLQPGFPPTQPGQIPGFPPPPGGNQPRGPTPNQFQAPPTTGNYPQYPAPPTSNTQDPNFNMNHQGIAGPRQPFNQPAGKSIGEFVNTYPNANSLASSVGAMSIQGSQNINLLQQKVLIPPDGVMIPKPVIPNDPRTVNCNPEVFRCTLNAIPQTSSLLSKARLPLGILIHPFKDLAQLPVIQSSVIVRCRKCRTYINPFVHFVDSRRWKCNLCFGNNELPDEFSFDPASKTYGDPQRRPEIKSATIEFIAPSEYMLRPPQPAVYLYLLDVSFNAVETGYLTMFCETVLDVLDKIPGDSRTQIGFIAYDSSVHFFNLAENLSQPQMLTVGDIDDIFLPCPDDLLVNLHACKGQVVELLNQLPTMFQGNTETRSALGAALQAAYKMMTNTGGRVTVMQTILPSAGPGALQNREDSTQKSSKDSQNLGPAIDFYKKLSLDFSAQQIAVDVFMFNGQYADLASIECISKFSAGCVYYYPSYHSVRAPHLAEKFEVDLRRYLTRKIGFESVMRIRCTRGISIHTFHGNFFVRSTDLLSLPNVNPDAGFGMQMSIEDSLVESSTMCFQAALLYTSSKGERRIRVHTLCLPITNQLSDIYASADQQAIVDLVSKMAVDRSISSSLSDSREAIANAAIDTLNAYGNTVPSGQRVGSLCINEPLRLMPLYCLALLKSVAFKSASTTKLDDRVYALNQCKTLPTTQLMQVLYPHLYPLHTIMEVEMVKKMSMEVPNLPLLQLSSANIDRHGAYLLDAGETLYLYVGSAINEQFCMDILGKQSYREVQEGGIRELPELDNEGSERMRAFMTYLLDCRSNGISLYIVRDDGKYRLQFFQHFVEDRTESTLSYHEFLQHIQKQMKS